MNPIAVEAWALKVVDQVASKSHSEDSRVELKADWPKPPAAARHIAAHANAARGAPILWLIGLDEVNGIVGAQPEELANWYSSVKACFEGITPSLFDLNVTVGAKTLVALLFQTDRAPFVVKNPAFGSPNGGSVELEVPWREGRKTRSARREDLVRLLAPLALVPEVECLECILSSESTFKPGGEPVDSWRIRGGLYVSALGEQPTVIPFHRTRVVATQDSGKQLGPWGQLRLFPSHRFGYNAGKMSSKVDSMTVEASSSEVMLGGPGKVIFETSGSFPITDAQNDMPVSIVLELHVVGATVPVVVRLVLRPCEPATNQVAAWATDADMDSPQNQTVLGQAL